MFGVKLRFNRGARKMKHALNFTLGCLTARTGKIHRDPFGSFFTSAPVMSEEVDRFHTFIFVHNKRCSEKWVVFRAGALGVGGAAWATCTRQGNRKLSGWWMCNNSWSSDWEKIMSRLLLGNRKSGIAAAGGQNRLWCWLWFSRSIGFATRFRYQSGIFQSNYQFTFPMPFNTSIGCHISLRVRVRPGLRKPSFSTTIWGHNVSCVNTATAWAVFCPHWGFAGNLWTASP